MTFGHAVFLGYTSGQTDVHTDRQTYTLIAVFCTCTGGEMINIENVTRRKQ